MIGFIECVTITDYPIHTKPVLYLVSSRFALVLPEQLQDGLDRKKLASLERNH